jgi:hypothetical protein
MEILDANPSPKPRKNSIGKVILVNFCLLIVYLPIGLAAGGDVGEAIALWLLLIQICFNLFAGFVMLFFRDSRSIAIGMMLSGFLIGIVGFGTCVGMFAVSEAWGGK